MAVEKAGCFAAARLFALFKGVGRIAKNLICVIADINSCAHCL